MATYRYARDSRTSAQQAAIVWQREVDAKRALIASLETEYPHMSASSMRRYNLAVASLRKLMDENPNEPV